jgi:RND family efflux transporter MFP subunit
MDSTVTTTGIVRLRVGSEVRVGSQLSGIVKKLNVTVGSHIEQGDVIAEIDSRNLEARIEQARAAIQMDETDLHKAEFNLKRSEALVSAGLAPRQQSEDSALVVESAKAKLEKSRRDLAVIESDLAYVQIRAPISGTVASVSTQEGETVAASFAAPTFITIIKDDALELIAMVDETDIGNVRPGNPATFTTETFPSQEFSGVVRRIAPKATIISGVVDYEVGIEIRNGRALKPDMTSNVTIRTAQHDALVIPNSAIERDGDDRFVRVVKDGKLQKRSVTIGLRDGAVTEIRKGLTAGESVVNGGSRALAERNPQ